MIMADPICRWRNTSIKQVAEFTQILPHKVMPKEEAHKIIESNWNKWDGGKDFFKTPYQLAVQLGLYYEDDLNFIPRFNHVISIEEAAAYLKGWFEKYYIPNPYTGSFPPNDRPYFLASTLRHESSVSPRKIEEIFSSVWGVELGNKDILTNLINNFSEMSLENGILTNPKTPKKDEVVQITIDSKDKKAFFDNFNSVSLPHFIGRIKACNLQEGLQQIFYGAPGTGKSHRVQGILKEAKANQEDPSEDNSVRVTFHPDTDYSSFVGAYKPTMKGLEKRRLSVSELITKLSALKSANATYPCQKFGAQYWESLQELSASDIKEILNTCGFTDPYYQEINKGIAVGKDFFDSGHTSEKITYSFVPQAFLKAYVAAWKRYARNPENPEPFFLVIEEINRGNCAQIFGDLFQLLDRDDSGESSYEISPDKDLEKFLKEDKLGFNNPESTGVSDKIKGGEILKLPSNLYILATMNTSDQSLFPIDSAFKRRWDWQYEPIAEGKKDGQPMGWKIKFSDATEVDWWEFLQAINAVIESRTHSEDKKLGYFFCRARDGKISAKTFLSKVIFYLWNDVFRDYGFNDSIFKVDGARAIKFHEFYKEDGSPDEEKLLKFVNNVLGRDVQSSTPTTEPQQE